MNSRPQISIFTRERYPMVSPTWMADTISYCGPPEYRGAVLSRVNFPGGYISGDSAYHYISDYQGNVRQGVNAASGHVAQENSYYPGGMLFGESTSSSFGKGSAANPYRFAEKEFITHAGLHLSLHGARMYDPALARFITPDPLAHQTPHLQQYLFCAANPVMYVDPTGLSTRVRALDDGKYEVTGGELDGDLSIFLCENDDSKTGILIGMTPVETSFYNSDTGEWMKGAIIDPNDNSGIDFINSILSDMPDIIDYSMNAYGGQLYDFKVTNGTETKEDDNQNHYRGMPIQFKVDSELRTYCSARDIGNIIAGYVFAFNGVPWKYTRDGFDFLESIQKMGFTREGCSSQNAQWFGYNCGQLARGRK